ncbi:MAG: response regulator transcription factor [Spirochaetales bacterium]|nr:response regulator transcription factor [Spirochaetales bacterium]
MKKILMIEDDRGLVRIVGDRLKAEGYEFHHAPDGQSGLEIALKNSFDLLLVDLMLPGCSGFDVIREFRSRGKLTPLIITSAKFQMADKVSGLRLGADDYLVKPFEFDELLARIEAQLRRTGYGTQAEYEVVNHDWLDLGHEDCSFGPFTLSFRNCELRKGEEPIPLSHIEFKLLAYLLLNRERVVPNDELLERVWQYDETVSTRTLYVHIAWLRKKLRSEEKEGNTIRTIRGVGYRFS